MKYEYTNSGIDWIGEVPKHWKVRMFKNFLRLSRGKDLPTEKFIEGEFPVMGSNGCIGYHNEFTTSAPGITIGRSGSVGEVNFVNRNFWAHNTALFVENNYGNYWRFTYYFLKTFDLKSFGAGSVVGTLNRNYIHKERIAFPPKPEQIAIANYLDKAFADIDRVVEIKRKQIENLQQQLKSIIHHTVTKGLNPNAEMKESGVDWIGEVPKHWKEYRLKDILEKIGSGVTPKGGAAEYLDEGIPLIRSQNVLDDKLVYEDIAFISEATHKEMSNSQVKKGDVLLNITGASLGRCFYYSINDEANVNQHVCILRPFKKIETRYLHLLIKSEVGQAEINQSFTGSGREGLNFKSIKRFSFFFPKRNEQRQIINHISKVGNQTRMAQSKIEKQIEILLAYKKSLIHEVVTGKKQVYGLTSAEQNRKEKQAMPNHS